MKNRYNVSGNQWWLLVLWVLGFGLPVGAQTTQPPVIHWQRVIERQTLNSQVVGQPRVVKASDGGYGVLTAAIGVLAKVSPTGNLIWQTPVPTLLEGNPSIYETTGLTATSDGGFVIVSRDNFGWNISKVDANGNRVWAKQIVPYQTSGLGTVAKTDLIRTADDGFLVVGWSSFPRAMAVADVDKFDQNGDLVWRRSVFYNYDADAIRSSTFGQRVTQTAEGDYVVVGQTRRSSSEPLAGWAAKLNGQGNVIWQNRYEERAALDDIILSPHFSGSYIASGVNNLNADVSNTLNLGADGSPGGGYYQPGRVPGTFSSLVAVPATNGVPAYHTVLDRTNSNSGDFRLTNLAQSDQLVWSKTLGGSGNDIPNDLIATGDGGYLVVGTTTSTDGDVQGKTNNDLATWIIKLAPAAPPTATNPLTLTQPSYNCQTGAITFNTSGGDGSPITYSAPGISRANVTDNFGMVEQGLRNDPKPITITATQSSQTVSYVFDLAAACGTAGPVPPVLLRPVPNQTYTLGQAIGRFPIGSYFDDPTALARYRSGWQVSASGLPDGLLLEAQPSQIETTRQPLAATIYGIPTRPGVYPVTIRATTSSFPDQPVTATFTITITEQPVNPPTSGSLTLTAPTYNCQTGAITFNTTGGDGSSITYSAPGISRANVTDNFGMVEQGLRNDPKPITITATQSGQTVSYTFDFGAFCSNVPTNGTLKLLAPTVECRSLDASLIINTTGGDGSPITYTVPGATLSSPTSNTANVFECINADNPSLSIQATQSGYTATYSLDLYRACPNTNFGDALIARQIPDLTLSVGQTLQAYDVSQYFTDPNNFLRYNLVASYTFLATGMPEGINYSLLGTNGTNGLVVKFSGTAPSQPGVYTVTITAGTIFCDPVVTSFKIIVTGTPVNPPTGGNLTLTQPTYNCQTGAITFNTTGGDGSPVTYSAPGISRANATDNFGTVEPGLRNDPKPITITATQSDYTTNYAFDLKQFCAEVGDVFPPMLTEPIPDQILVVGQNIEPGSVNLGKYFGDPNGFPRYRPFWAITSSGLPEGVGLATRNIDENVSPFISLFGTPVRTGSYTVTINAALPRLGVSTTASFKIIVTDSNTNPPTSGTLTLTQPTYNCQTGAITFNTSGGDGSPITYSAPGISRVNATDNFGTVEQGLRNDPKPITIAATQSGQTVSYMFDFGAFCSGNPQPPVAPAILPPVVNGPIPAMVRRPNSGRLDEPFVLSQYFSDPTPAHAGYRSNLRFSVDESAPGFFSRLPLGYFLKDLSAVEAPYAIIAGTPTLEGSYTVTVTATNLNLPPPNNSVSTTLSIQIIGRSESNPDNALRLTYPLYNCQTGVIVFNLLSRTTYNPAPIVYTAPGVILESPTSMTGIVESGLRANPGPITIMATQNGETAQYVFDLKSHLSAYCGYVPGQPPVNPPTGGTLTLLAPAYDCGSGALTFRTSGGDGSPIEYQAAGITGWTTNPNQFVDQDSRTANDVSPFMLMARQNGQMVTYTWDLKAACGRARIASSEPEFTPTLTVLGNPVSDQLRVVIRGAAGGPLRLQLTDMRGRLIENRVLEPTTGETEQVFDVTQQAPGLLLLRATTGKQVLTTKVLKR